MNKERRIRLQRNTKACQKEEQKQMKEAEELFLKAAEQGSEIAAENYQRLKKEIPEPQMTKKEQERYNRNIELRSEVCP